MLLREFRGKNCFGGSSVWSLLFRWWWWNCWKGLQIQKGCLGGNGVHVLGLQPHLSLLDVLWSTSQFLKILFSAILDGKTLVTDAYDQLLNFVFFVIGLIYVCIAYYIKRKKIRLSFLPVEKKILISIWPSQLEVHIWAMFKSICYKDIFLKWIKCGCDAQVPFTPLET